jgi:hypothetical protein
MQSTWSSICPGSLPHPVDSLRQPARLPRRVGLNSDPLLCRRQLARHRQPRFLQLSSQLADPTRRQPKHPRHSARPLATSQQLRDPPLLAIERSEPDCHVDPGRGDFCRAGPTIFHQHLAPLIILVVKLVEPLDSDSSGGDSRSLLCDSVLKAQGNLQGARVETEIEEVAADKGYHSNETIELCDALRLRTYIPEPKLKHERRWTDKPAEFKRPVHENRRRMKRAKGKRLGRLRSERVERSFAHICDIGGTRRSWLKGVIDVTKRYLIAVAAHNLGTIMRKLFGIGKPKTLQDGNALAGLGFLAQLLGLLALRRLAAIATMCRFLLASLAPSPRLRLAGIKTP